ncbi:MAG: hypothetical protein CMN76_18355 [Spirochaetaceae bacterium]|nr:hypothetical protein [Spirochaetaceae bacterium]|tara:strand:- start:252276 stop:253154 length:879 start_codon:yes stop_codon:yes gene_type:complete
MNRNSDDIDAIEHELEVMTTPAQVFRVLTSQTELRKWWAPRVIMSRNLVTQLDGKDMEMKAVTKEKNHLVRYSWRGKDWPDDKPSTVITFEIADQGVSRGRTGEGILLTISHDGWVDQEERDRQAEIWKDAVAGLECVLAGKDFKPWWQDDRRVGDFLTVQLNELKDFIGRIEEESRAKKEKKQAAKNLWKIFQELDGQGDWLCKENGTEMELRFRGIRIFGALKNGQLVMAWRDLDPLLGRELQDFADRFTVEQDMDIHVGRNYDRLPGAEINPDLFSRWCKDVMAHKAEP